MIFHYCEGVDFYIKCITSVVVVYRDPRAEDEGLCTIYNTDAMFCNYVSNEYLLTFVFTTKLLVFPKKLILTRIILAEKPCASRENAIDCLEMNFDEFPSFPMIYCYKRGDWECKTAFS